MPGGQGDLAACRYKNFLWVTKEKSLAVGLRTAGTRHAGPELPRSDTHQRIGSPVTENRLSKAHEGGLVLTRTGPAPDGTGTDHETIGCPTRTYAGLDPRA